MRDVCRQYCRTGKPYWNFEGGFIASRFTSLHAARAYRRFASKVTSRLWLCEHLYSKVLQWLQVQSPAFNQIRLVEADSATVSENSRVLSEDWIQSHLHGAFRILADLYSNLPESPRATACWVSIHYTFRNGYYRWVCREQYYSF